MTTKDPDHRWNLPARATRLPFPFPSIPPLVTPSGPGSAGREEWNGERNGKGMEVINRRAAREEDGESTGCTLLPAASPSSVHFPFSPPRPVPPGGLRPVPDEERREVGMVRVWLGKSHDGTGLMSGSGQPRNGSFRSYCPRFTLVTHPPSVTALVAPVSLRSPYAPQAAPTGGRMEERSGGRRPTEGARRGTKE